MSETLASTTPLTAAGFTCRNTLFFLKFSTLLSTTRMGALLLIFSSAAIAETTISAGRVWPAAEYTRITLESATPIQYSLSILKNPDRVVVDLEDIRFTPELENLPGKVGVNDPYIRALRIGRFKPGVLRLVLDLKTEVVPQAFEL